MQTSSTLGGSGVSVGVGGSRVGWLRVSVDTTDGAVFPSQADMSNNKLNRVSMASRLLPNVRLKTKLLNFVIFLRVAKTQPQVRFVSSRVNPPAFSCFPHSATWFVTVAAVVKLTFSHERRNFSEISVQLFILDVPKRQRSQPRHISDVSTAWKRE